MESQEAKFGTGTYVSIGLLLAVVGTVVGGVYTLGAQAQKMTDLESRMARQESYAADLIMVREQVKNMVVTLTEVRNDVKDIKETQRDEN